MYKLAIEESDTAAGCCEFQRSCVTTIHQVDTLFNVLRFFEPNIPIIIHVPNTITEKYGLWACSHIMFTTKLTLKRGIITVTK